MEVSYAPSFIRQYKNLPALLKQEVKEKVSLFADIRNHQALRVHKLKGSLKEQYGLNVNYEIRIVFWYMKTKPKEAVLLAIGDHEVYKK
ncbi:plasmid stabilization protein [Candidatus Uhrbacteria bacterium]|nr:plasmid stabilization protein [Candidatus Uhrbacteria bacterium]